MAASKRLFEDATQPSEATQTPVDQSVIWHTESLWQSASQTRILPALLRFHRKELRILKDRTVPVGSGRSRTYTTLDHLISVVKPALAAEGMLIHQHLAGPEVVTMLVHESGEFIASKVGFTPMQGNNTNALQNAGGGLTYLKRYAISALLNINSDEDNDGADTQAEIKPTPDSQKLASIKTWLDEGKGTLDQVQAKYNLTTLQLNFLKSK